MSSQESSPITLWKKMVTLALSVVHKTSKEASDNTVLAQEAITSATIELVQNLIGEDEQYPFYPRPLGDEQAAFANGEVEGRNKLRADLRQSLKEMSNGN